MKIIIFMLIIFFSLHSLEARIAIVIGKNSTHTINKNDIKKIFIGEKQNWANGNKVIVVTQYNTITGKSFSKHYLNIEVYKLLLIWEKLVLSGQINRQIKCKDDDDVKQEVNKHKDRVGYIDASKVDGSVKVLLYIN